MVKSSVQRLVPKVPRVPGVPGGRRAAYSASTRRSLIDAAERLFVEQGYGGTSLDAVVAAAEVTKGALYHHFSGKQAVYEAVFERVEQDACDHVTAATREGADPWTRALGGLRAFLEVVREPRYLRIVVQDGPSVLGYERFREQEERSSFAVVLEIVESLLETGTRPLDAEMRRVYARIFFGALSTAGETVATAEDTAAAAQRVESAIGFMLAGFQVLLQRDEPFDVLGTAALLGRTSPEARDLD